MWLDRLTDDASACAPRASTRHWNRLTGIIACHGVGTVSKMISLAGSGITSTSGSSLNCVSMRCRGRVFLCVAFKHRRPISWCDNLGLTRYISFAVGGFFCRTLDSTKSATLDNTRGASLTLECWMPLISWRECAWERARTSSSLFCQC